MFYYRVWAALTYNYTGFIETSDQSHSKMAGGGRARRDASPSKTSRRGDRGAAVASRSNLSLPPITERSSQGPSLDEQSEQGLDISDPEAAPPFSRSSRADDFNRIIETANTSPERQRATRSRRAESAGPDPPANVTAAASGAASRSARQPARNTREPTPEQQLQQDLRRASEEPESPTRQQRHQRQQQPQPQQPQPQRQQEPQPQQETSSSSIQESSVSWVTERTLGPEDRPQRQQQSQGQPLVQQQQQRSSGAYQPSTAGGAAAGPSGRRPQRPAAATEAPDQPLPAPADDAARFAANNPTQNFPVLHPTSHTAANAPVIPENPPARDPPARDIPTPSHGSSSGGSSDGPPTPDRRRRRQRMCSTATVLGVIMTIVSAISIVLLAFRGHFAGRTPTLRSICGGLCGGAQIPISYGTSGGDAIQALEKLSSTVDSKLADMANDMAAAKVEMEKKLADIPQVSPNPLGPMRVNFFSIGTGAIVDPYITSPTMQPPTNFAERVFGRLIGVPMEGMSPVAALKPWHDVGECWCSPGSQPQLAVRLGYPIVPEEVVIEHIPKDETLDPGLAPEDMELWAEFSPVSTSDSDSDGDGSTPPYRSRRSEAAASASSRPNSPRRSGKSNSQPHPSSGGNTLPSSAHDYLLTTLRMTYPDEPDTAFSNNPRLGPQYFRLGKWRYDVHRDRNVQRFRLDAVVGMPGYRVKKAIVRVTSNWGGSHTCLYRVRLHGLM